MVRYLERDGAEAVWQHCSFPRLRKSLSWTKSWTHIFRRVVGVVKDPEELDWKLGALDGLWLPPQQQADEVGIGGHLEVDAVLF